jgi:hypothetical protein
MRLRRSGRNGNPASFRATFRLNCSQRTSWLGVFGGPGALPVKAGSRGFAIQITPPTVQPAGVARKPPHATRKTRTQPSMTAGKPAHHTADSALRPYWRPSLSLSTSANSVCMSIHTHQSSARA